MIDDWSKKAGADEAPRAAGNGAKPNGGNGAHADPGAAASHQTPNPDAPAGSPFQYLAPEGSAKTMSAVLGEIVWLMSQSQIHKSFFISDLEWFVMTPVLLKQFRLFYDNDKPIGVVLWARVSEAVEQRLAQGTSRLKPQDWTSGDRLWVVEVISPFGGAEEMVKDLKAAVFPDREVKMMVVRDGKRDVRVV